MLNLELVRGGTALHARAALDTTSQCSSSSRRDEEELVQVRAVVQMGCLLAHLDACREHKRSRHWPRTAAAGSSPRLGS